MREAKKKSDGVLAWARARKISGVSLGRLLLEHALRQESANPSCAFVDICPASARASAASIARAWEIKVDGLSAPAFRDAVRAEPMRFPLPKGLVTCL